MSGIIDTKSAKAYILAVSNIFDMEGAMAFREKSAWISLLVTLCIYGDYFFNLSRALLQGVPFTLLGWIETLIGLTVVGIVLNILVAASSPKAAQTPRDERERLIGMRASGVAFYVLLVGVLSAVMMFYFVDKVVLAALVVAAVGLAQTVQYAGVIVGYRRGA